MGEYTGGVDGRMKHETAILHGVIIALVAATVTALTLAGVAVGRMRMAQDELDEVKADERTYREGYYATLARVEELEWQLEVINGGK